jgi:hypothetical protein
MGDIDSISLTQPPLPVLQQPPLVAHHILIPILISHAHSPSHTLFRKRFAGQERADIDLFRPRRI